MAYINVNHTQFSKAADSIDEFVRNMSTKMASANGEVNNLSGGWQGTDFIQFKTQWEKVTNGDSTYTEMKKAFETYSKFLRYAGEKYRVAQENAVNAAYRLPKY